MSSRTNSIVKCGLCMWLLAAACVASAQNAFSPGGEDYKIAGSLVGDQTHPQAAITADGGVLVWQDNGVDGDGLGIRASRLNANLIKTGSLIRVNADGAGDQEKPDVALLHNGGSVVVWQGGQYGFQKIYARILAADGSFLTGDILVNTYTDNFQVDSAVATLADGSFVVVWASYGQDRPTDALLGIYGQLFSATGEKLGGEFQVNQWTRFNQRTPDVSGLSDGGFVVAWISELQRASASVDVYARIFDASGNPAGNEFPVNPEPTRICANPQIAGAPQGSGFALAWSQNDNAVRATESPVNSGFPATTPSTNGWDVVSRICDGTGSFAGAPVLLNTRRFGDQYAPKISAFGKEYLAVWTSLGQDTSWEGVFGQFLTSDGNPQGVEFRVNTTALSRQIHPSVTTDGVNRFLALWSSFGAGTSFDLFARAYDLIRLEMTQTPQGLVLSWNSQPGLTYQVQMSSSGQSGWSNVGAAIVAGAGEKTSMTVKGAGSTAYYRVIRVQ